MFGLVVMYLNEVEKESPMIEYVDPEYLLSPQLPQLPPR